MKKHLFLITSFSAPLLKGISLQNIFLTLDEAVKAVHANFFDLWEGGTNKFIVIESFPVGEPWAVEEIYWFRCEYILDSDRILVFSADKPKELEGICSFFS